MQKRTLIIHLVAVPLLVAVSFWGGMQYAGSQAPARGSFGAAAYAGRGGMRAGNAAFAAGVIMAADPASLTLGLQNGNSEIVYLATSTQILKSASGTAADLIQGANVVVTGTPNQGGSMTAQSIQIRPSGTQRPELQ